MASIQKRPDGVWRARYRDPAGKEHARHFRRKVDAQRWLDEVTTSMVSGTYVAPRAGRVTFKEYAEQWRLSQVFRPSTDELVERAFRRRVYPVFGSRPLDTIRQEDVQRLVSTMQSTLAPATVTVTYSYVSSVFKAAVTNLKIGRSPCEDIKLPEILKTRIVPLTTDQVLAIADAVPARLQAAVMLSAGTGMRQGEVFGLTRDRLDFLRRKVVVDRQLVGVRGLAPTFGPPKTPTSVRDIPLATTTAEQLAVHLEQFKAEPADLVFRNAHQAALRRSSFGDVWRRSVKNAGLEGVVFHELRHYYASLLIRYGESVTTVQARLGHKSAEETLNTYSHLWPDSDDRTREAVDAAFVVPADSVRTLDLPR